MPVSFTGELNGNGYEIQNLFLDVTSPYGTCLSVGLFCYLDGTVKNLGIINADVASNDDHAAILAGYSLEQTNVDNCYTSGCVYAVIDAGGLVNGYGNISNCWADVDVYAEGDGAGGIAGGLSTG